jgi:Ser/Thr protein kinase RdoA (MazF antagonist)
VELLERPLHLVTSTIAHRSEDAAYIDGLADRDGCFTFYDFDCCGWGCRAYDSAIFPWAFAIRESVRERIEAMGHAFLKGYT